MEDLISSLLITPSYPAIRIMPHDKIVFQKVDYSVVSSNLGGAVLRRMDGSQVCEGFTQDELAKHFGSKTDIMECYPSFYSPVKARARQYGSDTISGLSLRKQQQVLMKLAFVLGWKRLKLRNTELIRQARIDKVAEPKRMTKQNESLDEAVPVLVAEFKAAESGNRRTTYKSGSDMRSPSGSTLGKWIHEFDKNDCDPISLQEKYASRRRKEHFTPEQEMLLQQAIAETLRMENPRAVRCHELLEEKIDALNAMAKANGLSQVGTPCVRTVQNRINLIPGLHQDIGRLGEDEAIRRHGNGSEGMDVIRPLERVEIDEHKTDLQTLLVQFGVWEDLNLRQRRAVKRTRLWITAIIDCATRYIIALKVHAEAPSARTAIAALEMATKDKTDIARALGCTTPWDGFGGIESMSPDSAAWLTGRALRLVATDMGCNLFIPAAGQPHLRGTMERAFQTMEGGLEFFSGKTWWSVDAKGNYDSEANASVIAAKVAECLIRFIVDGYHNRRHVALGMSPRDKWRELNARYSVLPPPTGSRRRHIFGINIERTVSKKGMLAYGIYYNSKQLQRYVRTARTKVVLARVDSHDIQGASVLTEQGWINVPATVDGLQGVSIWKLTAALEKVQAIGNRNGVVNRKMFVKTIAWLHQQAEMARLEAEVDSPILSDVDYERIEKKLDQQLDFDDEAEEFPIDFESEWGPSPKFFDLVGIEPVQFSKKKETKAVSEPERPDIGSKADAEAIRLYTAMARGNDPISDEAPPAQINNLYDE